MNSESTQEHEPQWENGQLALLVDAGTIYPVEVIETDLDDTLGNGWTIGVRIIDENGSESAIAVSPDELSSGIRLAPQEAE